MNFMFYGLLISVSISYISVTDDGNGSWYTLYGNDGSDGGCCCAKCVCVYIYFSRIYPGGNQ